MRCAFVNRKDIFWGCDVPIYLPNQEKPVSMVDFVHDVKWGNMLTADALIEVLRTLLVPPMKMETTE